MRSAFIALCVTFTASSALGETVVESCFSGMQSSEGGETVTYSKDGEVRRVSVTLFGHSGRLDFTVTPTGTDDAVLHAQTFHFEGLFDAEANYIPNAEIKTILDGEGSAIVVNGSICKHAYCFNGTGDITKDWLQNLYSNFTTNYSNRMDCTRITIP